MSADPTEDIPNSTLADVEAARQRLAYSMPSQQERLTADELAYLNFTTEGLKMAQAAQQSYLGFLSNKYGLTPNDVLDEDGSIKRQGG